MFDVSETTTMIRMYTGVFYTCRRILRKSTIDHIFQDRTHSWPRAISERGGSFERSYIYTKYQQTFSIECNFLSPLAPPNAHAYCCIIVNNIWIYATYVPTSIAFLVYLFMGGGWHALHVHIPPPRTREAKENPTHDRDATKTKGATLLYIQHSPRYEQGS